MSPDSSHSRQHLCEQLVDKMNCGIVARDRRGTIVFVNQRLLDWLGYEPGDLVGEPMSTLVPPELKNTLKRNFAATHRGDLRTRFTIVRRRDGTTFPAVVVPQRLHDDEGEIELVFSVVIDVGALQTARNAGHPSENEVRSRLTGISMELQSLSLASDLGDRSQTLPDHPSLRSLTARERGVLQKLVAGERVAAIAAELHVSPHTVRNHLKSIFRKVGVGSQADLIRYVRSVAKLYG